MTKERPNLQVLQKISDNKKISTIASVGFEEMMFGMKRVKSQRKQDESNIKCNAADVV